VHGVRLPQEGRRMDGQPVVRVTSKSVEKIVVS